MSANGGIVPCPVSNSLATPQGNYPPYTMKNGRWDEMLFLLRMLSLVLVTLPPFFPAALGRHSFCWVFFFASGRFPPVIVTLTSSGWSTPLIFPLVVACAGHHRHSRPPRQAGGLQGGGEGRGHGAGETGTASWLFLAARRRQGPCSLQWDLQQVSPAIYGGP